MRGKFIVIIRLTAASQNIINFHLQEGTEKASTCTFKMQGLGEIKEILLGPTLGLTSTQMALRRLQRRIILLWMWWAHGILERVSKSDLPIYEQQAAFLKFFFLNLLQNPKSSIELNQRSVILLQNFDWLLILTRLVLYWPQSGTMIFQWNTRVNAIKSCHIFLMKAETGLACALWINSFFTRASADFTTIYKYIRTLSHIAPRAHVMQKRQRDCAYNGHREIYICAPWDPLATHCWCEQKL